MKIDFEGRTWQLDAEAVDMEQALAITAYAGMTLTAWESSCIDPEHPAWLKSIRCLYWLMLAQNGESAPLESVNFAVLKFYMAWAAAITADAGKAAEAAPEDPTMPAAELAGADSTPPPTSAGSPASPTAT